MNARDRHVLSRGDANVVGLKSHLLCAERWDTGLGDDGPQHLCKIGLAVRWPAPDAVIAIACIRSRGPARKEPWPALACSRDRFRRRR
jgi:hypothetical protein